MKFSIIVVCLNPGEKLKETLDSVLMQTWPDYEIIVKDGGSRDDSLDSVPSDERIKVFVQKDRSIYDAMNQAVSYATGAYILFLNCGDLFYNEKVLEHAAKEALAYGGEAPLVLYGDTYGGLGDVLITAPPKITGFVCYRNIPCHQSCFYATCLCKEKPFEERYRVRADYDHFLWCFYRGGAEMLYLKDVVSLYEGGGFSESKENKKRDREEHAEITGTYMGRAELLKYRLIMLLTLAPLRRSLSESTLFAGCYHKLKTALYKRK